MGVPDQSLALGEDQALIRESALQFLSAQDALGQLRGFIQNFPTQFGRGLGIAVVKRLKPPPQQPACSLFSQDPIALSGKREGGLRCCPGGC